MKYITPYLALMLSVIIYLPSANASEKQESLKDSTIQTTINADGTQNIRIYFNYTDPSSYSVNLRGGEVSHTLNFPNPEKWEVLSVSGHLKYSSSGLLLKRYSAGIISFNDSLIKQFRLLANINTGVGFEIEPSLLKDHNKLTIKVLQHYTLDCEDPGSPKLWTEINLKDSFVEFIVKLKPITQSMSSLKKSVFDTKQYKVTPLNYVTINKEVNQLKNYALFTGLAATHLQHRRAEIFVSPNIDNSMHNVLIGSRIEVTRLIKEHFGNLTSTDLDALLFYDVNLLQNPLQPKNAIIAIISEDVEHARNLIIGLAYSNLSMHDQSGINITKAEIPPPFKAYSAKNFLPLGIPIYFNELGYKSRSFKGGGGRLSLNFKVYPDNNFTRNDKIRLNLHYAFPSIVRHDSTLNILFNDNFIEQIGIVENSKSNLLGTKNNRFFKRDYHATIPSYMIDSGNNQLTFDFSLIPFKDDFCTVYNRDNLVATIFDDSSFVLPNVNRWIEMPYMEHVFNASYPYSIFPDLQQTTFLLGNKSDYTIAAAMNFLFFLAQDINSIPYRLSFVDEIDEEAKNSHIIAFGSFEDSIIKDLSENAPIKLTKDGMQISRSVVRNFTEHLSILNPLRGQKYQHLIRTIRDTPKSNVVIMQMLQSPFNKDKSILLTMAVDPKQLKQGMNSLLKPRNRHAIEGDLTIHNFESQTMASYNIKDKYIFSDLSIIDTITLTLSKNIILYIMLLIFLLLLIAYLLRKYLVAFKRKNHRHVE